MFPIRNVLKHGDALSPLVFNFALEDAIRRVQVNQGGLKVNGTHQLLAYADEVVVVLHGCETWSLILREERRLRVFENRVLERVFGPKRDEVTGEWRKLHNE